MDEGAGYIAALVHAEMIIHVSLKISVQYDHPAIEVQSQVLEDIQGPIWICGPNIYVCFMT